MISIETAAFAHIGTREEQQDSVGMWTNDRGNLIVVADGVGGSIGGAAASQCTIKCADDYWNQHEGLFSSPKDDLTTIAEQSHEAIRKLLPNEKKSPSSTLVILYLDTCKKEAHWVHMGDSRLYRMNDGKTIARTRDHSIVQLLLEQGEITEDELNSHPDKGRILKSLGASTFKGVDYDFCEYSPNDTFLLCSDGYWESLSPSDNPFPPKPPGMTLEEHTKKMVLAAVKRNGEESDNTTVAIASMREDDQASPQQSSNVESQPLTTILIIIVLVVISIILGYLLFMPEIDFKKLISH